MMNNCLMIFVEGQTDQTFIEKLFGEKIKLLGETYKVIHYANKEKKKLKNYITSINKMDGYDYIFLADQDGKLNKKENILEKYPFLERDKVFISIYEIESWIISGISGNILKKFKMKFSCINTEIINKEKFDRLIPEKLSKIEFISYIIDDYDIEKAIQLNASLNEWYQYLKTKKAS